MSVPLSVLSLYGALVGALVISSFTDWRQRRIPNLVTLPTMALALLLHGLHAGWPGLLFSLKGLGLGFGLLLLPHLLGGIGAGDVKLMAAVGAVLGAAHTLGAFLAIAILGGFVALGMMAARGELWAKLKGIGIALYAFCCGAGLSIFRVDRQSLVGRGIPYGIVIAAGTGLYVAYQFLFEGGLGPWPA